MTGIWHRWVTIWCWGVIAFGALLAAAIIEPLRAPAMMAMDLVFWPLDGDPATLSREAVLTTALAGALTMGWGILMLALTRDETLSQSPRLWRHITTALLVWYVIDSTASVLGGAAVNALSNTILVAAYLIPVIASGVLTERRALA